MLRDAGGIGETEGTGLTGDAGGIGETEGTGLTGDGGAMGIGIVVAL